MTTSNQVVWNFAAGELWRRARIALERTLRRIAKNRGIDPAAIRVSYGKVAEMQRRGVVHFHAIIRLDGIDPNNREAIVPAPEGIGLGDLVDAVEDAARHTRFITEPHGRFNVAWLIGRVTPPLTRKVHDGYPDIARPDRPRRGRGAHPEPTPARTRTARWNFKRWYTMREVAEMLGYGVTKVKTLVITGELRSVKDGKNRRILPEWVDEYVARRVEETSR
jgi:excisionase family DNA binding protein